MSLAIYEGKVRRVLLSDGWHKVVESTFILDAYEYLEGEGFDNENKIRITGGGNSTGFKFASYRLRDRAEHPEDVELVTIAGELSSIIAVELGNKQPKEVNK